MSTDALGNAALPVQAMAAPYITEQEANALPVVETLVEVAQRPPLTPDNPSSGGVSISGSTLRTGDIIVSTTAQISSGLIRWKTNSNVSHTAVYIGDGQVVEAIPPVVTLRSLEEALGDDTLAVALRDPNLTVEQGLKVRDYLGQQLDKPYGYTGAALAQLRQEAWRLSNQAAYAICRDLVRAGNLVGYPGMSENNLMARCEQYAAPLDFKTGSVNSFFCSQLVLAAFSSAGVPLTTSPPVTNTPQEIVELDLNGRLEYVGHLKTSR